MANTYDETIDHPSAWRGPEFASLDDISFFLTDRHLSALAQALASARAAGHTLDTIEKGDFDLSPIADDLAEIERELLHGRGIVIVRGFPVADHSLEDIEIMYWGLGTYLGTGEPQSKRDKRLAHVTDDRNERAYRNNVELMMHSDITDLIGMLSIREAPQGGLSMYVSAAAVHNEILATRPEHLEPLYRGFRYHRFGAEAPDEEPITPHRIPVLSERDGRINARYVPDYVYLAGEEPGEPIALADLAALDYFREVAMRPDLRLDMMLKPGDLSFINNYTVLHARDAFYDGETETEKRLMLRLWLATEYRRSVVGTLDDMYIRPAIVARTASQLGSAVSGL